MVSSVVVVSCLPMISLVAVVSLVLPTAGGSLPAVNAFAALSSMQVRPGAAIGRRFQDAQGFKLEVGSAGRGRGAEDQPNVNKRVNGLSPNYEARIVRAGWRPRPDAPLTSNRRACDIPLSLPPEVLILGYLLFLILFWSAV